MAESQHHKLPFRIEVGEGTVANPSKIGCIDHPNAAITRIIHISDTHLRHNQYIDQGMIPDGDILVHSGDFTKYCLRKRWDANREFHKEITELNYFFECLPHKHKIFVAGNHEITFTYKTTEKIQKLLTNGIYLQDTSVTLEGLKFYGAPWNNWRFYAMSRGFALDDNDRRKKWQQMPDDVDVLITHNPPLRVMDRSRKKFFQYKNECEDCCDSPHPGLNHWGCPHLRDTVLNRVRPAAHLFGHCHDYNGLEAINQTLFSNAAMDIHPLPKVIHYYHPPIPIATH